VKTNSTFEIQRWRLSAWTLTGLSILWLALSGPAAHQLLAVSDWTHFTPMDWLCAGLVVAQFIFIASAAWAWLTCKTDTVVVEKSNPPPKPRGRRQVLIEVLFFLGVLAMLGQHGMGVFTIGMVVVSLSVILEIRRQRRWLEEQTGERENQ
jgi:drug/metabolite transporter (DMT)-like permease